MSGKIVMRLGLMACAVLLVAGVPSHAWDCFGTLTVASSESTSSGSNCGGSYLDTHTINDVYECLRENSGDDLYHTWTFSNVPAGNLFLVYKGYRPSNPDSEYFKFSGIYDEGSGPMGVIMPGAVINKTFEPPDGLKYDMSVTTTSTSTFNLVIRDSNASGTTQSNVYLDYLAICSESND